MLSIYQVIITGVLQLLPVIPQTMNVVDTGCRLAPPPGTPRDLYQLMMVCW